MCGRIREGTNDLVDVPERQRPAMGYVQPHRRRTDTVFAKKMDRHAFDGDAKVLEGVDPLFDRTAVEPIPPIRDQIT
jgi:hypothetical protein